MPSDLIRLALKAVEDADNLLNYDIFLPMPTKPKHKAPAAPAPPARPPRDRRPTRSHQQKAWDRDEARKKWRQYQDKQKQRLPAKQVEDKPAADAYFWPMVAKKLPIILAHRAIHEAEAIL